MSKVAVDKPDEITAEVPKTVVDAQPRRLAPEPILRLVDESFSSSLVVEPGAVLGNYRLIACVARGGMASVWVARQQGPRGFSKLVALKMILPELVTEPGFEDMFSEEARFAGLIRHPNVCEVFELLDLQGTLALSMEWIDGDTLGRMLKIGGEPLDYRVAAKIVADAAAGLHAAHELRQETGEPLNLVHRDVSPQNILISREGFVKLSDFGIAKAFDQPGETTAVGQIKGKVAYMSPEQTLGCPLDRRSDVFSLGAVLYLATVGRPPFTKAGASMEANLESLRRCELLRPRQVRPGFPKQLEAIIVRALQRHPDDRYPTAAALRLDLEQWLASSGHSITEREVAQALNERCGRELDRRHAAIREALVALPRPSLGSDPGRISGGPWSATLAEPGHAPAEELEQTSRFPRRGRSSWRSRLALSARTLAVAGASAMALLLAVAVTTASGEPSGPTRTSLHAATRLEPVRLTPLPRALESESAEPPLAVVSPTALPSIPPPRAGGARGKAPKRLEPDAQRRPPRTAVAQPSRPSAPLGPTERDL